MTTGSTLRISRGPLPAAKSRSFKAAVAETPSSPERNRRREGGDGETPSITARPERNGTPGWESAGSDAPSSGRTR